MSKIQMAIMGAVLAGAMSASASWYDISYTGVDNRDSTPVTAVGAIDIINGYATSGSLAVTDSAGTMNYILAPGAHNDGYFAWDSQVNVSGTPVLDSKGLVFQVSNYVYGQPEVNLYGNGPGNYGLWGYPGHWDYSPQSDGGSLTLTAVPEPTTMVAGALLLLPFGASTLRMLRRRTA